MSSPDVAFLVHACQFIRRFPFRQRYNPERIISISLPIEALAVDKQLIMLVIRILIGEAFTCIGFMHVEDEVLRFVHVIYYALHLLLADCAVVLQFRIVFTPSIGPGEISAF